MNQIIVPHGVRQKLQKIFNKSHPFVRKALNGNDNSTIASKIRKAAIENGGYEVEIVESEKNRSL